MPNAEDTIEIAKVSQYLTGNNIAKGSLFGKKLNPLAAMIIYMERKALEWLYDLDSADTTLQGTANYVYALLQNGAQAQKIIAAGSGGTVITPVSPDSGSSSIFPIYITESDFEADGVSYDNANIVGKTLLIFINEIPKYLIPGVDFTYTVTGVTITMAGFDANTNTYNLVIENVTT